MLDRLPTALVLHVARFVPSLSLVQLMGASARLGAVVVERDALWMERALAEVGGLALSALLSAYSGSWYRAYRGWRSLAYLSWRRCSDEQEAAARKYRGDPYRYGVQGAYVLRVGGHYFCRVYRAELQELRRSAVEFWAVAEPPSAAAAAAAADAAAAPTSPADLVEWRPRWTTVRNLGDRMPTPRDQHAIRALPDGRVVLHGGSVAGGDLVSLGDLWVMEGADLRAARPAGRWREVAASGEPPAPRHGHVLAAVPGRRRRRLLLTGGSSSRGIAELRDADVFVLSMGDGDDYDAWHWARVALRAPRPLGRCAARVRMLDDGRRVLLMGGSAPGVANYLTSAVTLDLETGESSEVPTEGAGPGARRGHVAILAGSSLLSLFGGDEQGELHGSAHVLRVRCEPDGRVRGRWRELAIGGADAPCARKGAGVVMHGSSLTFNGGFDAEGEKLRDAYELDFGVGEALVTPL